MTIPTRFDTVSPEGGTVVLIQCPECELNVSDKALACPHCGCPMTKNIKAPMVRTRHNKRRRLPNGFGQISEIKNRNLRKPFRAMVTVGKNDNGKPICKPLKPDSYFETYNEAYAALVAYNKNPYDLNPAITVQELYNRWSEEYFKTLKSDSSVRSTKSAWSYCSIVYRMRAMDLRSYHIKGCMEDGYIERKGKIYHTTPNLKERIKSLFNLMMDYAVEHEIVDRNYSRAFDISEDITDAREEARRAHIAFNDTEMERLWENLYKVGWVDVLLIQCYSGWRPQELGLIEMKNVDLDNGVFVGGMKTRAGKDRVVPIHSKIYPLIKERYNEALQLGSKYLFNCTDTHTHRSSLMLTYDKYNARFKKIVERLELNPEHRAHDGRKQFITTAKKYKVDEYAIKYIVGHEINDVTEKVYTDRDRKWLKDEIEKIK